MESLTHISFTDRIELHEYQIGILLSRNRVPDKICQVRIEKLYKISYRILFISISHMGFIQHFQQRQG